MRSSLLTILHGGQSVNGNSGTDNGQECASTNLSASEHQRKFKQKYRSAKIQKYGRRELKRIQQARKLQATLVRNYYRLTYSLTGVRCRATSVAKNISPFPATHTYIKLTVVSFFPLLFCTFP